MFNKKQPPNASKNTLDKNNLDKQLWRKLIAVIILKLIIIMAIYWAFMRPNVQKVDDTSVEKHLVSAIFLSDIKAYNQRLKLTC